MSAKRSKPSRRRNERTSPRDQYATLKRAQEESWRAGERITKLLLDPPRSRRKKAVKR